MVNQRYRAIYLAALIVVCIGLLGSFDLPKGHAVRWGRQALASSTEPSIQQRIVRSYRPLFQFASLGLLSSVGLGLLYSRNKA